MYNNKPTQLNLNLATPEQLRRTWAFATHSGRVITACSAQARAFGIQVGMQYDEAKALIPDMRILLVGKH